MKILRKSRTYRGFSNDNLVYKQTIEIKPNETTTFMYTIQPQTGTLELQINNKSKQNALVKIFSEDEQKVVTEITIYPGQSIIRDITLNVGKYTVYVYIVTSSSAALMPARNVVL